MKKVLLFLGSTLVSIGLLSFFVLQQWPQYWWILDQHKTIKPTQLSPKSALSPPRQSFDQYLLIEWDQKHVYYLDWVLPGVAPQDFSVLGDFIIGNDFTDHFSWQDTLATNQVPQQSTQNNYQETSQRGYYLSSRSGIFFLNESGGDDPPTLKKLTSNPKNVRYIDTILLTLLRTESGVFLEGNALAQVDPNGFDIACPENDKIGGYFRSKSAIYYINTGGEVHVLSQNSTRFQCLPNGFAHDQTNVFLNGHKIRNADPKTFQVFHETAEYAKDQSQVYYRDLPIPLADAASFAVLDHKISQQQSTVLQGILGKTIPLSDDICIGYDHQYIYLEGKRIEGISSQQLQLSKQHEAHKMGSDS